MRTNNGESRITQRRTLTLEGFFISCKLHENERNLHRGMPTQDWVYFAFASLSNLAELKK